MIHHHVRTPIIHSMDVADARVGLTTMRSRVTTVRRLPTHLRSRLLGLVQGLECGAAEPTPAAAQLSCTFMLVSCQANMMQTVWGHRYIARLSTERNNRSFLQTSKPNAARGFLAVPAPYSRPLIATWAHGWPCAGTFMEIIGNVIVINSVDLSPWEAIRRSASQRVKY